MGTLKDFYGILKDLISEAKKVQNQEVVSLAMDLQEKFFELREENENLNGTIKKLEEKIDELEKAKVLEEDIEYSETGFFTLKTDKIKIPYCSMCWKKEHKLIPLSQQRNYWQYKCGNCKTDCVVFLDKHPKKENEL